MTAMAARGIASPRREPVTPLGPLYPAWMTIAGPCCVARQSSAPAAAVLAMPVRALPFAIRLWLDEGCADTYNRTEHGCVCSLDAHVLPTHPGSASEVLTSRCARNNAIVVVQGIPSEYLRRGWAMEAHYLAPQAHAGACSQKHVGLWQGQLRNPLASGTQLRRILSLMLVS